MLLQLEQIQGLSGSFIPLAGTNLGVPVYGWVEFALGLGISSGKAAYVPNYYLPTGALGSATNPRIIRTANDFDNIRNNPNDHYRLVNALNLSSLTAFVPITLGAAIIDGGNNTISNLIITQPDASGTAIGVFTGGGNATVKNLFADNISVSSTNNGIIGGTLFGSIGGTLQKCGVTNSTVNIPNGTAGGLAGWNQGSMSNCFAQTRVTGRNNAAQGGSSGSLAGTNSGNISDCYAYGLVNNGAGGISVGGLIGNQTNVSPNGTTTGSYYDSTTTGQSDNSGKGVPQTTAQLQQQATYTGWDFSTVWNLSSTINNGYPNLYFAATDALPGAPAIVSEVAAKYKGSQVPAIVAPEDIVHKQYSDANAVLWYVDDVPQTGQKMRRVYNVTVGTNGIASKYLTTDGATKGAGNSFLFSSVFNGGGNGKSATAGTGGAIGGAFQYNSSTGLLQVYFETAGLLGQTNAANGTAVVIWAEGLQ